MSIQKLTVEIPKHAPLENTEAVELLRQRKDTLSAEIRKDDPEILQAIYAISHKPDAAKKIAEENPLYATYLYLKSVQRVDAAMNPPKPTNFISRMVATVISQRDIPSAVQTTKAAVAFRDALKGLRNPSDIQANQKLVNTIYGPPDAEHPHHPFTNEDKVNQEKLAAELFMPDAAVKQLRYVALAMSGSPEADVRDYLARVLLPLKVGHNTYVPYNLNDPALQETADTRNVLKKTNISWKKNVVNNKYMEKALDQETMNKAQNDLSQALPVAIQNIDGRDATSHTNLRSMYEHKHED